MIKISHEVPLCLLEESLSFNDYDYALPHLLESNEEYRNFFLESKKNGREIYLDNSLHELGYAMDNKILLKWIEILEPSNFFIPDVWENKTQSIVRAREWSKFILPENVTKVAVVQAKSLGDAIQCAKIYSDLGYKKIAFSYGANYYNEVSSHPNKSIGKALGRVQTISEIQKLNILTPSHKIHLLGTASPFEFALYKDIKGIESIDTSNPVMAAIENISYNNVGTHDKPKANLNNYFDIDKEKINIDLLNHNVNIFKQLFK